MSATRRNAAKPLTPAQALTLLESAVMYCKEAGLNVRADTVTMGLAIVIGGAALERTATGAARFIVTSPVDVTANDVTPARRPAPAA